MGAQVARSGMEGAGKSPREPGRVQMAARRLENQNHRLSAVTRALHEELDRLAGAIPRPAAGQDPPPIQPDGELHVLDRQLGDLEVIIAIAEDALSRARQI